MIYDYEMKPHVNVDGEWIDTEKVTFVDIEEDLYGYDVMTFEYNGKQYRSRITQRPT